MKNKSSAFTLIELLVVVLIIGILAAVAVPQYEKAVAKARFTELKMLTKQVYDAQKLYYLANGTYTSKREELGLSFGPVSANTADYRIPFAHGECGLEGSKNSNAPATENVYCTLSKPNVLLMFQLNSTRKTCCNYELNNTVLDQLCKDEMQVTSSYEETTTRRCYVKN